ncbi:MAG: type VI secretion system protein TssA [Bryobacteraceae bacterium]|nr:type VI secretion system protein TssA [Bryobacteraceae bacterium]MDW8377371.1 type VI secretion system protein TssA [Bryobacterales bacterium]
MALREDLLKPISESNPSGQNARYDPNYDKVADLRKTKEDPLSGTIPPDWKAVVKLAEDLLTKKTKDLQLAVWLTEAYIVLRGISGLKDGLILIKDYLENYWDTLYPALEEGDAGMRLAPLDWLGGKYLENALKSAPLTKAPHNYYQYQESQLVGFKPADDDYGPGVEERRAKWEEQEREGKVTGEAFRAGLDKTPKQHIIELVNELNEIQTLISELNAICSEKFQDEPPSFAGLTTIIQQLQIAAETLLEEKRKSEPDEQEAPAAEDSEPQYETQEASAAETSDTGSAEAASRPVKKRRKNLSGIEPADVDEIGDRLAAIADFLRGLDTGNPAPYLMLRGYRWGELRASGGTAPDASLLEPPSTEVRTTLKKYLLEGAYEDVLREGEQVMATPAGRGWLDLQRYVVTALENLGYSAPASAIKSELKALLADLPDLLGMTLMDDTPVANAETRDWIQQNVLPPAPASQTESTPQPVIDYSRYYPEDEPEAASDAEQPDAPPDAFQLAQEAVQHGHGIQAIEILVREMNQERSGRAKFNRKLQLAQICLSLGQTAIAKPILEELAAEIDRRRLEEWEAADMVAHALSLLYRCLDGEQEQARKQEIYRSICRLDPVQAFQVQR